MGSEMCIRDSYNPLSWNYWGTIVPGVYPCGNCTDTGGVINATVPMAGPAGKIAGIGPPLISRTRALESRHMGQICERWAIVRRDGMQHAFINGMGYASWESIWYGATSRRCIADCSISSLCIGLRHDGGLTNVHCNQGHMESTI